MVPAVADLSRDEDGLRRRLAGQLASGLDTHWQQRADTQQIFDGCVQQLQQLDAADYAGKLRVAGFTDRPYEPRDADVSLSQACATCMYYLPHRRFCQLPELQLPVEALWSCRLWRI